MMLPPIDQRLAHDLKVDVRQIAAAVQLLDEGTTVPFVARYRKEATGSLDEVAITAIRDRLEQLAALDSRREAIFRYLEERELLTDELKEKLTAQGLSPGDGGARQPPAHR